MKVFGLVDGLSSAGPHLSLTRNPSAELLLVRDEGFAVERSRGNPHLAVRREKTGDCATRCGWAREALNKNLRVYVR